MGKKIRISEKNIYSSKRYWYHVSTTLIDRQIKLIPWDFSEETAFNRSESEPLGKRICVAPSIEQCIVAIPYDLYSIISVYRTKNKVIAKSPNDIFDSHITQEGWITRPMTFIKLGIIDFEHVAKKLKLEHVPYEMATSGMLTSQEESLKWWKKIDVNRFLKKT